MDRFIQISSFLCLIFVVCSSEEQHDFTNGKDLANSYAYDINNLIERSLSHFQNSYRFKNQPPQLQFQPVYENFISESIENSSANSTKCVQDLIYIGENLKTQWALKMLDSYGKPDSGILEGSMKWTGDYSECIEVYAPPKFNSTAGDFHGQYCSVMWGITLSNFSSSITSGVCLPSTCSASEIEGDILKLLQPVIGVPEVNKTMFDFSVTSFKCKPIERHLNTAAKTTIAILSLFCALVVLGSFVSAVKYFMEAANASGRRSSLVVNIPSNDLKRDRNGGIKKDQDSDDVLLLEQDASQGKFHGVLKKCETFLECFCVFHNGAKLLNTSAGEGELLCIHGIRFLSMSWVILGHTYAFAFTYIRNILETVQMLDNFPFQIVLQGFFSVDSFFVLSGFLLTYLSMREYAKNKGGINWPYFYIHRYIRLTPVYMLVLAFSATVYFYVGSGPFWVDGDFDPICRDYWWWNILYINNFESLSKQCMGWSWYLANDMQFFVISPIFLISLWRWPKIGYSMVMVFLVACWLSNFVITYHFDLVAGAATVLHDPMADILIQLLKFSDYMDKLYIKPYTRIAPYLIGMLVGHIFFTRKSSNKPKHNLVTLCVGWTIASVITLVCVYGLYHTEPSLLARSFYNAFSRTVFAVGLCWVIYVCLMEQGGFVNSLLSYKLFIPLSRLTYSAYLIHPLIITGYYSTLKTPIQFSQPTMIIVFLGAIVVTYGLSLPVALMFESPIIALEKLIRKSFIKKNECTQ